MPSQAPLSRLIENVSARVKAEPKDAEARFLLARLYSLLYAGQSEQVPVFDPDRSPRLPAFTPIQTEGPAKRTPSGSDALWASLTHYAEAVKLAPTNGLVHLGYGWMLEQAGKWVTGPKVGAKSDAEVYALSAKEWYARASKAYAQAVRASRAEDEAKDHLFRGIEAMASLEAAQNLLRMHREGTTKLDAGTEADLRKLVKSLESKPQAMTPIVFPLSASTPYRSIDNPKARVKFDMDGSGLGRRWTWINPNAAFLCWNPLGDGRIDSGRDLFGNTTFWMFFRHGYDALAALDDNLDGQLAGPELRFIAVWHDRNANGLSEPGEVRSLAEFGIVGIRTRPQGREGLVWLHQRGLIRRDGSTLPTYDWVASRR